MKHLPINTMRRWLLMLLFSFLMYEVLWTVIELQFDDAEFVAEDVVWDFAQCAIFTSVVFIVSWAFSRLRGGHYHGSVAEILTLLIVNAVMIFLIDKVFSEGDTEETNFWGVIDIYIICVICSLLSIIDIQRDYNKRFVAIKQEQMRLRLKLLQQQLSPHFMFNSLSTLQGMIAADPQKAESYVAALSDMLRYITENISKEKVALSDAIRFIESYEEMLSARFPEHFLFNIDSQDVRSDAMIVPVSLQIAIENAIKHNNHSRRSPLAISIKVGQDAVMVSNRKQPVAYADSLGVGLKNLNERYKLLIGQELAISETKEYYTVSIPLIYESIDS